MTIFYTIYRIRSQKYSNKQLAKRIISAEEIIVEKLVDLTPVKNFSYIWIPLLLQYNV